MIALTSAATTVPSGYYQSFASQTRTMASDVSSPGQAQTAAPAEEQSLDEARQQTYDLKFLQAGWNGCDAQPPSETSIDQALRWLVSSYTECKDAGIRWHKPNISASAEGEVVFEWWSSNRSLLVYVEDDSVTYHKSLSNSGRTEHMHGDAPLGKSQAELLRWFGE